MTALGERIKCLKTAQANQYVECGKLMRVAAQELTDKLSTLFEDALTCEQVSDESELTKVVVLKQPIMVCVINDTGAELRVDLNRYKEGMLKEVNDVMRGMFLDMTSVLLQEKYPEYRIRRNGGVIEIKEPPPPPMPFLQWVRSLFKPRELI